MTTTDKLIGEAVLSKEIVGPQQRSRGIEGRSHQRNALKVDLRVEQWKGGLPGHTMDISSGGVGLMSEVCLVPGTPLMLRCCLGGAAQLHVAGQVVYCRPSDSAAGYTSGLKFASIHDWETTLLVSVAAEFTANADALGQSFLTIHISKDRLGVEATAR